jgi:uncharacterized membrane protein (DUF485 family)
VKGPSDTDPANPAAGPPGGADAALARHYARYAAIDDSPEFRELRSKYRRFVFPVTLGALVFYFAYAILAAYAPGFMGETITGNINVGLVFGFLQFAMVFGVTTLYVRYARRTLDPAAEAIRDRFHLDAEDDR